MVETCASCRKGAETWEETWDRKRYCVDCLRSSAPAVLAFLTSKRPLQEALTRDMVSGLRHCVRYWTIFGALFGAVFMIDAVQNGKFDAMIGGFTAFGIIFSFCYIAVTGWLGVIAVSTWLPRETSVLDGNCVVRTPDRTTSFPLSECSWFEGLTSHDRAGLLLKARRAIVIQTPLERVACGLIPGMYPVWKEFLLLAGVTRGRKRRRQK